MSVQIKNILQNSAGSLNTRIPIRTVPTAPMPVHTAYEVPIGSVCEAFTRRIILMVSDTTKPVYHSMASFPLLCLALPKQEANATSNNPAIIRMIQLMANN